jgi:hypothetical protein
MSRRRCPKSRNTAPSPEDSRKTKGWPQPALGSPPRALTVMRTGHTAGVHRSPVVLGMAWSVALSAGLVLDRKDPKC